MSGDAILSERNRRWFRREGFALLTDYYELTMMAGYWKDKRDDQSVCFNYFFRALPPHAGFAVTAGLEPFLDYLEHLRFEEDDLDYLHSLNAFPREFVESLRDFRAECTVRALPEGSLAFPFEPVIQVEGRLSELQLIETALLNMMNFPTLIATKAARVCQAANGEPVLEFGLRRAHGPDGGISGSRAAYIGGCKATSNVLAGKAYGIPIAGTHAHSWVMSFSSEYEAFRSFAEHYPQNCILLVDTYDTLKSGVPNAIRVYKEMRDAGTPIRPAIRLDSGDLSKLSKIAYRMMIDAGLEDPLIVASNDLEEDLIADLKRQGAKVNAWGVGTHLITSRDCPSLNGVYKLVAIESGGHWIPRMKVSSNIEKATDPGKKQIVRYYDADQRPLGDVISLDDEVCPEQGAIAARQRNRPYRRATIEGAVSAMPMMRTVVEHGKRTGPPESVEAIRARAQTQIEALPEEFKRLRNPEFYQVLLSTSLGDLKDRMLADPSGDGRV